MLLTNGSLLNGNPGRRLGSFMLGDEYKDSSFQTRNTNQSNVALVTEKSGLPNGYNGSKAWVQPRKAGGLSLPLGEATGDTEFTAFPAAGINLDITLSGSTTMTLSGALVTGATLILSGSTNLSADVIGKLEATISLAGSTNFTAAMSALAGAILAMNGSTNATFNASALANLTLDLTPFTELSAENLAKAVWNYIASQANNPGTMGEKLNDAGSASNPWTDDRALTVAKFLGLK